MIVRILYLIGAVVPLMASEIVVLNTGFRLHAEKHEVTADQVKIYQGLGFLEIPCSAIAGYEPEDTPVAVPLPTALRADPLLDAQKSPELKLPQVKLPEVFTPQQLAGLAAKKYSLPESFVRSVMKAESNFRIAATSPKGAIGLMQLMESTAKQLGVNPKNPRENAEGGARYLMELLAKYERDPNQVVLALAAYNAGPEAVERYHGVPPFRETREYILRVLRNWDQRVVQ